MQKKDRRPTRIYPDSRTHTQPPVNCVTESPAKPAESKSVLPEAKDQSPIR